MKPLPLGKTLMSKVDYLDFGKSSIYKKIIQASEDYQSGFMNEAVGSMGTLLHEDAKYQIAFDCLLLCFEAGNCLEMDFAGHSIKLIPNWEFRIFDVFQWSLELQTRFRAGLEYEDQSAYINRLAVLLSAGRTSVVAAILSNYLKKAPFLYNQSCVSSYIDSLKNRNIILNDDIEHPYDGIARLIKEIPVWGFILLTKDFNDFPTTVQSAIRPILRQRISEPTITQELRKLNNAFDCIEALPI